MNRIERTQIIDELSTEFDKIYYEVMNLEEVSHYRYILLSKKLNLIYLKLKQEIEEFTNTDKKARKKLEIYGYLLIIMAFISIFLLLVLPSSFIVTLLIQFGLWFKVDKVANDIITKEEETELEKQIKNIVIVFENIKTFASSKYHKNLMTLENAKETEFISFKDYSTAISLLTFYLDADIPVMIPERIRFIIVNMLQKDLNTDINDIHELIKMAKEKIKQNNIEQELRLNRSKKESKVKK